MEKLYTWNTGNPQGKTILFLHGGGGGGWMWRPQVEALKDAYHILAPDLPEHGQSAGVKPFTIQGSADCAAEIIRTQAHGGRAHVVGLSEGAQVLVALLAMSPELVDHAVISSALVRPMAGMNWFGPGFWTATYRSIEPLNKYDWWVKLNARSYGIPDEFLADMRLTYKSLTAQAFAHILVENQAFRLPAGLDQVHSPTLVVGGRKEYKVMRESIRDVAAAIPQARGYLVHHSRRMPLALEHNWNLSTPELFTRTVRAWIEDRPLPQELEELK
jgi:pimeloyl-ACP methyl ester carboxylesterase